MLNETVITFCIHAGTEFLAVFDITEGANEDPAAIQFRLTIRRTRMIDPTRAVATPGAIDHKSIPDIEAKRVIRLCDISRWPLHRDSPWDTLLFILADQFSMSNCDVSEDTVALNRGPTYQNTSAAGAKALSLLMIPAPNANSDRSLYAVTG